MFDIAPLELLVCAVVALLVIGPKDLPKAMRFVGKWVGKARRMAGHFRAGLDTMMREAELKEMEEKWRAHNEAIMRAHPHIDLAPPPTAAPYVAPSAPSAPSVPSASSTSPAAPPPASDAPARPLPPMAEP